MARECKVCGSRKWRKDAVSGSLVCEEGHVMSGVREETLISEPTGHAMQKRRTTKGPRVNKKREYGMANRDFFHGQAAEYLRIQGLQLLLRHQVAALTRLWSLPDALEVVVRELWSYQLLLTPIPKAETEKAEATPPPQTKTVASSQFIYNENADKDKEASGSDTDNDGSESDGGKSDRSDRTDRTDKTDAELIARLSDDSDEEDDDAENERRAKEGNAPIPRKRQKLKVSDTLVCLLLGLWLLRIPFTHVDIESLVNTNEVPYIDFAKSTLVPPEMFKHMNHDVQLSLRPQRCPPPMRLYRRTLKFARILTRWYGQIIPEINVQPLAWHVVSQLGGSAVTHSQVVGFLYMIDANMSLNDMTTKTVVRKRRNSESGTVAMEMTEKYQDIIMPELSIACAWVVVMKLAYGLDGQERLALLRTDPLIGMPKGEVWLAELEKRVKSGVLKSTSRTDLEPLRFDLMSDDDMDRWLDRAEGVLLKNRDFGIGAHLSQFPLHPLPPTPAPDPPRNSWTEFLGDAGRDPVRTSTPGKVAASQRELPLMPGEGYRSYDAADVTGTLPAQLQTVLQAAADVVGVPVQLVAETVQLFERRMEARRPKREYYRDTQPAFRRVRASGGLRESRSLDRALNEYR